MKGVFMNVAGAWAGDVMGYADKDGIQLNYLYDTDNNGIAYHPIHRFTTNNFYEYVDNGEIIPYGNNLEDPDLAVGTGSFIRAKDGMYHCFYTGHNDKSVELSIDKECIMHAVSADNMTWKKMPEDTFYAPEDYSSDDFRDPQVFYNEEKKCYYMLLGARKEGKNGGIIALYTSDDLSDWILQEPFYEQDELYFLECPDLFKMGDYYYLFYSWNNVTYYRMSKSMEGPWEKPRYDVFDGNAFYAAKTVEFKGKRYLAGFINRKKAEMDQADYSWAGSICVYELVQKEDGSLGVDIPSQLVRDYFTKKWKPEKKIERNLSLEDKEGSLEMLSFGVLPESMMISGSITFDEKLSGAGFAFGDKGNMEDAYAVWFDVERGLIRYDKTSLKDAENVLPVSYSEFDFEPNKEYPFKVVIEKEIIIIYLDSTKVLSSRIYQAVDNRFGIFVRNGRAEWKNIKMFLPE